MIAILSMYKLAETLGNTIPAMVDSSELVLV